MVLKTHQKHTEVRTLLAAQVKISRFLAVLIPITRAVMSFAGNVGLAVTKKQVGIATIRLWS